MTGEENLSQEEIEALLSEMGRDDEIDSNKTLKEDPRGMELIVSVVIKPQTNRLNKLMTWQVGDFIPMDEVNLNIFVNGSLVAHGELATMNDKFGICLKDII